MNRKVMVFVSLVVVCFLVLPTAAVVAKKPEKPPGQDPAPPGTLYFYYSGWLWSVNADGSQMTQLTQNPSHTGELSRLQHGGHYWFLRFDYVDGVYPDGVPRQEIFAFRDDNSKRVQLTDDATLATSQYSIQPTWGINDVSISWSAKKWVMGDSGWEIQEAGIYQQEVQYDNNDDVVGLAGNPTRIWDPGLRQLPDGNYYPDSQGHDWSPDGTRLVHWHRGLYIVDVAAQTETYLAAGHGHEWSPDGTMIAYSHSGDLTVINVDGTNERILKQRSSTKHWDTKYWAPSWSPDSKCVSYTEAKTTFHGGFRSMSQIYYIDLSSGDEVCFTKPLDTSLYKKNHAWR